MSTVATETLAEEAATEASTEVGSVFVSNYPPFSFWQQDGLSDYQQALQSAQVGASSSPLGLYLHIPFCRKRCKFCYFRVYIDKNAEQIQTYLDALAQEVELYSRQPAVQNRPLKFVYFGGGTPSYIAVKHLEKLIARIKAAMPWDSVEEVTFECEPGTLTRSKVAAYREIGVTRLSLGIENWNDAILRDNGRAHLTHEIDRCLPWIREQAFDQLNVDLIAGMVGETWDSWRDSVQKTIDIDPDSVTIYQMELPYNTVYSQGILAGGDSPVADWQTKREWNLYAIEQLQDAGYELSSAYTMLKQRSRPANGDRGMARFAYRDSLWHGADMLGTGVASFGHVAGVHAQNVSSWNDYLAQVGEGRLPLGRAFRTTAGERLTRELILQMKLGRLDLGYFRRKFDVDPLAHWAEAFHRLAERQMLEIEGTNEVVLTTQGLLQVDSLLTEFYDPKYRNARYT
ncbi:MAG: coproporphyrinogen-III oxidase family protein [Acidobacteriota bacterium]